jgi:hypothetical protein
MVVPTATTMMRECIPGLGVKNAFPTPESRRPQLAVRRANRFFHEQQESNFRVREHPGVEKFSAYPTALIAGIAVGGVIVLRP